MTDTVGTVEKGRQGSCLEVVRHWLDGMHGRDIAYCHFKSNAEVAGGLAGLSDMDVLVDRGQYGATVAQLCEAGFKRFKTAAQMDYPAVDDYLAYDRRSGRLVHLHLHWQMIAGEPYLKGFRLPWERMLLAGRRWDAENGVYVSAPEAELLLLLTRAALKLRSRDRLRAALGRPYFRGGLRREYDWLVQRSDREAAVALVRERLGEAAAAIAEAALAAETIADRDIFAFRRAAWPVLRRYRRFAAIGARLRRWWREGRSLWGRLAKRLHTPTSLYRRGPAGGGVVVALLGVDGAGKSTHCQALVSWLRWKVDVMPLYLGSGDGPKSLPRRALSVAAWLAGKSRRVARDGTAAGPRGQSGPRSLREASFLRRTWMCLWAVTLAQEKSAKLRRAFRARNRGMIVIADRYPQNQVMGYNDGPLLDDLRDAATPWRDFARWEARLYQEMVQMQPDLVVKLDLSPEVALARKSAASTDQLWRKADAVRQLRFAEDVAVVSIDAGGSLDEVSLAVTHAVWDAL